MSIEKKLLALYESLVRTLTFLFLSSDIEQDAQRILVNVLHDATEIFDGRIKRAAVLVPNDTQDYLCCLVSYHMPQESIQNMNFYVGRDQHLLDAAQGVAGHAFLTRKVSGGHIELVNGSYECRDNKYYKKFVGKRSYSPYASFITIPIVSADSEAALDRAQCLGVICFDSSDKDIFDTEESKIILSRIARHAASVLTIRQRQQKKV